jgi:hypothetical protein
VSEDVSEDVSEVGSEDVSEDVSEVGSDDVSEDVSEVGSDDGSREDPEDGSRDLSEAAPRESEDVSDAGIATPPPTLDAGPAAGTGRGGASCNVDPPGSTGYPALGACLAVAALLLWSRRR